MISMALRDTFIQACNSNDLEEVRKCLSKGVDVNTVDIDLGSGLSIAAFHNNLALLELLLAHPDIDVNLEDDNDDSPLSVAMNKDHQVELMTSMMLNVLFCYRKDPQSRSLIND